MIAGAAPDPVLLVPRVAVGAGRAAAAVGAGFGAGAVSRAGLAAGAGSRAGVVSRAVLDGFEAGRLADDAPGRPAGGAGVGEPLISSGGR
jgi:hypothetical protein